jgi:hypothetical protein
MTPFNLQPFAIKNLSTAHPPKKKIKPGNAPLCAPEEVYFPPHQSAVWELLRETSLVTSASKIKNMPVSHSRSLVATQQM